MLQKMVTEKALAVEKVNDPPVQADSSIDGEVNLLPGGVTRSSGLTPNAGVRSAYQINPDIKEIREDIKDVKDAITKGVYADLFRLMIDIERSNVTATEIAEKQSERLSQLAPFTERLNNDFLNPVVTRVFNIMLRNNLFPPFPPEMQGVPINIKYISLMAQAQKMVGVTALENHVKFNQELSKTHPTVVDNLNADEVSRAHADMMGIPSKAENSPSEVDTIRKSRAEQEAQEKRMQAVAVSADAAAKGGKAIKDTAAAEMNTGSALDGILEATKELNR
jgi:hypothetical protein